MRVLTGSPVPDSGNHSAEISAVKSLYKIDIHQPFPSFLKKTETQSADLVNSGDSPTGWPISKRNFLRINWSLALNKILVWRPVTSVQRISA